MELAAARHGCKVCGKSFPCGRSLGGHMRSHLSLGEATVAEADADDEVKHESANFGRSSANGVVGYGLRENPRKTRRLSDFAEEEEDEVDGGYGDGDGEKLFGSWRSLLLRSHASGGRDRDEDDDVEEDEGGGSRGGGDGGADEAAGAGGRAGAAPRRRRRSKRVAAPAPAPPPVLVGFEKEQEDVALCLLMLSRDTGLWSSPVKVKAEPFDTDHRNATAKQALRVRRNGHAYNSDEDSSALLQYGYGDAKTKRSRKRSSSAKQQQRPPAPKRTRYECPGCGKVFGSYQALGGHRASHKRINTSCSAPPKAAVPAPEPSAETYASFGTPSPSASPDSVAIGIGESQVSGKARASEAVVVEKFECPVCFKVFASGQALGGHKRSHLLAAGDGDGADQVQHAAGFLDLNFPPAPAEEA
ncbi:hypothetical protein EJB05_11458, partial [Eragrostis curvula]